MKLWVTLFLFAVTGTGALAATVGERVRLSCFFERLNRYSYGWKPSCRSFFSYNPQQCYKNNRCWCVDMRSGRSLSQIFHAPGQVDCYRTAYECPPTKSYVSCGSCEITCAERLLPKICTTQCRQGCYCLPGTYLSGNTCVVGDECPANACNATRNEQWDTCATPCDATCDDRKKPCSLLLSCNQRCACPSGHVRNADDVCVPEPTCPSNEPVCPSNQEMQPCGQCTPTCDSINLPSVCTEECRPGCSCPIGTVLLGQRCVTPEECPPPECNASLNEEWKNCAAPCDATCSEPWKICSLRKSCSRRCACPEGHVRNENNVCVAKSQCSAHDDQQGLKRCEGEVCFCVFKATGEEIRATRLPAEGFKLDCDFYGDCPGLMTYSSCATVCPPTCNDPSPRCVRKCALDCQCPYGMVRASETNKTCINYKECQEPHSCKYQRAMKSGSQAAPRCNVDGTWSATQCDNTGMCWCVNADGTVIPKSRTNNPLISYSTPMCEQARLCDSSAGKEWNSCATPCDSTCDGVNAACAATGCIPRCACKPGYVLREDGASCIPKSQCTVTEEPRCNYTKGEVWSDCAPSCDATCEEPRSQCSQSRICLQRCTCPEGAFRDATDTCVTKEECLLQPRSTLSPCEERLREIIASGLQDFVPRCNPETKEYMSRQCHADMITCWCVNTTTGQEIEGATGDNNIDCERSEVTDSQQSGDAVPPPQPGSESVPPLPAGSDTIPPPPPEESDAIPPLPPTEI